MKPVAVSAGERDFSLAQLSVPLRLQELLPSGGHWEVELGFGKGRYLLQRAADDPANRFLGIEMASAYYRLARDRARRRGLANVVLIRGEALLVLAAVLPAGFASRVHVYFPDPWPKARHQKRRLFDSESIDLVLGLLRPGGRLLFATDHLEYGAVVQEVLASHPSTEIRARSGLWPDGARTNYEAKYERQGRPILRLEVEWRPDPSPPRLHPAGRAGVVAATRAKSVA